MENNKLIDFGIITDFYGQSNYGGVLQAYALARLIEKQGYSCHQIKYCSKKDGDIVFRTKIKLYKLLHMIYAKELLDKTRSIKVGKKISARQAAIDGFMDKYIPSSDKIYNRKSILSAADDYTAFVAGSDQIWSSLSRTNLLDFVPPEKSKFSYAASIARDNLTDTQKELFRTLLPSFQAVSVREKNSTAQLSELGISSTWVLDPTLLLSKQEWDSIASNRIIGEPYIFCYFLGDGTELRDAARRYADKKQLKLVTIPYLHKKFSRQDFEFGDMQVHDASPSDFISLIKYADTVLTDSFHGTVFSAIYEKPIAIFKRPPMDSRILTLAEALDCIDRVVEASSVIEILDEPKPYLEKESFLKAKLNSEQFLHDNLSMAVKNNF